MPTSTRAATAKAAATKPASSTPRASAKAPKVVAGKGGNNAKSTKTVDEKLKSAKEKRAQGGGALSPPNDKENAVSNRTSFEKLPLESILAPAPKDVLVSEVVLDKGTRKPLSDEMADLAFLGITGATPGGRKWRSRMKQANKEVDIRPMGAIEEAEVA